MGYIHGNFKIFVNDNKLHKNRVFFKTRNKREEK